MAEKNKAADIAIVLEVEGIEDPHTLATATIVFPDGMSGYYEALAGVLEDTAKHLREDADAQRTRETRSV